MFKWLWRHVTGVVGSIVLLLLWLEKALTWVEHADFVGAHFPILRTAATIALREVGEAPGWLLIVMTIAGLYLIYLDVRPRRATVIIPDYSHTLAILGFQPSLDKTNIVNRLEIRVIFQNTAESAVKLTVVSLQTEIEGIEVETVNKTAVMARGGAPMTFFPSGGLSSAEYLALPRRPTGNLVGVVRYGHPDQPNSRELTFAVHLDLFRNGATRAKETVGLNWTFTAQEDHAI